MKRTGALTAFLVLAYFAALPALDAKASYVFHAVAIITLGVLVAAATSGSFTTLAVTGGALGAFFHDAVRGESTWLAGAGFAFLIYLERTLRMRSRGQKFAHGVTALIGGAFAGSVIAAYQSASPSLYGVALVVGTAFFSIPLVLDPDDAVARALERTALSLPAGPAGALREAAMLKRGASDVSFSDSSRETVAQALQSILKLGETRAQIAKSIGLSLGDEGSHSVALILDRKILSHVEVVKKAFAAEGNLSAIVRTRDSSAVESLAASSESLDEVRKALEGDDNAAVYHNGSDI
jgi:hypothetical protein